MGNITTDGQAKRQGAVVRATSFFSHMMVAGTALAMLSCAGCRKAEPMKAEPMRIGAISNPGDARLKGAKASISALWALSEKAETNKAAISAEIAKMGSIVKGMEPEDLLRFYWRIGIEIKDLDRRMKSGRGTSAILVACAGIRHAKDRPGGISEDERLGAIFALLPFLPEKLQPKSALDVLDKHNETAILMECMEDMKQGGKSGFIVGRIRDWAEGRSPFSDESLLFLFATMK